MRCVWVGTAVWVGLVAPVRGQDLTHEFGIPLVTVRSPGNRDATLEEAPGLEFLPSGSVGYEYRIGRSELTTAQWLEFVSAYGPYWAGQGHDPRDFGLTGEWIDYTAPAGQPPSAPGGTYSIVSGAEQWPTNMGWRFAARYCNWLHNDKAGTAEAFEAGAYDTSTFTENPDGSRNDQVSRSPGARFWIPSVDEYVKAMFYDPDRYGEGMEGYWLYPDSGNEPLIPGLPEDGGETSAGLIGPPGFPVDQYPWVRSPWGLLDGSGGVSNWTESVAFDYERSRYFFGSWTSDSLFSLHDRLDTPLAFGPPAPASGFRVAGLVPAPGPATVIICAVSFFTRRGRA